MNYRYSFLGAMIVALAVSAPAMAGDPTAAVSDTTVTLLGAGGSAGGRATGAGGASVSFPVSHSIGAQFDSALSQAGGTGGGELGTHLFTRDPDAYLIGGTFEWSRFASINSYRYGLEAEAYLGDFTIAPAAGIQRGGANRGGNNRRVRVFAGRLLCV